MADAHPARDEPDGVHLLGQVRHESTIRLQPWDPEWPVLYRREATRIRSLLGDVVLQLEHVGSTSVPGLSAKPVIDLLLVVADSADEAAYVPALESAGYVLTIRQPDWHEHRLLKGPDTDINLHVFGWGSPEAERTLRFRDRLRSHEEDRALYQRTKQELARRRWRYVQDYADAKSAVVEEILRRAEPPHQAYVPHGAQRSARGGGLVR